jgi:hypothetical protein
VRTFEAADSFTDVICTLHRDAPSLHRHEPKLIDYGWDQEKGASQVPRPSPQRRRWYRWTLLAAPDQVDGPGIVDLLGCARTIGRCRPDAQIVYPVSVHVSCRHRPTEDAIVLLRIPGLPPHVGIEESSKH